MIHGLLKYEENKKYFNIGDNIQSLAAKQYLPTLEKHLNREKLADYKGEKIKLFMNGWFTHNSANWVPSDKITPLFVSFHMNIAAASNMLSAKGIKYLRKHEPIGCRDKFTEKILRENGINAYFTGCLTLTLDNYKVLDSERGDDVYIVDPLYGYTTFEKVTYDYKSLLRSIYNKSIFSIGKRKKHLKNIIDLEFLNKAKYINHELPSKKYSTKEKFELAENLLYKYARAKLVITSRIHCALPCLALGTPVIFLNGFDSIVDSCRFDGVLDLFNRIDIDSNTGKWKANFKLDGKINENTDILNLEKHQLLAENLKDICKKFILS